jgi:hypothetical protein
VYVSSTGGFCLCARTRRVVTGINLLESRKDFPAPRATFLAPSAKDGILISWIEPRQQKKNQSLPTKNAKLVSSAPVLPLAT